MFRDKTVYSSSKHRSKTHFSNPRFLQSVPHFSPTRCSCLAAFIRLSLTNLFLVAASCPASCRTFTAESNITTLQTVIHTPLVKTDRVVHAMCPSQNLLSLSCRQLPVGCHFSHKMTPEKPKRELWVGHGLEPRPQFHVNEICGGKLKKPDILAPSSLRPSTLRPFTLRVPTLRAPTLRAFTLRSPFTRHTLRGPSEVGNRFFGVRTRFLDGVVSRTVFFWVRSVARQKNNGYTTKNGFPKHGPSQEQHDHYKARDSTRNAKKK